ncbi:MAG: ATP-binding protein involved in chromosome partitioning [Janthinobacterium sp.]|jgi:ATP-binding protein involved in chromosome partitioning
MNITVKDVKAGLATVIDPNTAKDFISSRSVKNLVADGNNIALDIELGYRAKSQFDALRNSARAPLQALAGVGQVSANMTLNILSRND